MFKNIQLTDPKSRKNSSYKAVEGRNQSQGTLNSSNLGQLLLPNPKITRIIQEEAEEEDDTKSISPHRAVKIPEPIKRKILKKSCNFPI